MKKLKRVLGLLLAVCVLAMSLPLSALAAAPAYSDTEGHWAEKVIETWSDYDIVHGSNGQFRPNAAMTRGEFATVMSNLLGLEEKSENPFKDITGKEWYAKAVLQANAAGILLGDNKKNANATANIQRQEAFVMVGRALGVVPETNTSGALAGFDDKGKVSNWAKPMVAALVKGGYVNGLTSTTLAPGANINRASVIQIVGNTVKTYITEPGSYTADKDGFVVVKAQGSVTVSGDSAGIVVGAGSKGANVIVSSAQIKDGAKVDAPNAVVTLDNTSIGSVVTVSPSAKNTEIVVPAGSTVDKIVTQADSVTVSGDGEVKAVEVAAGDKVNVSTPGTTVTVAQGAGSNSTAGGQPVKPGESVTTSGSGQGNEDEGGSTVPVTPKYTIQYYVNGSLKETKTVTKSDTAVLPALTAPTVPGYTFTNTWYLDEACTGTPCDASKPIQELLGEGGGTTLKLYIKGTPITYTITFNGNDETSGSVAQMAGVAYNTTDTLPANGFTKTGYTFAGWNTKADGTGTNYAAGAPAKELATEDGATVTLYAKWTPNTYTVTYDGNGNTSGAVPSPETWTYGTTALTAAQPGNLAKTGYEFNGWNTADDGSGTTYAAGASLGTLSAEITLYAKWSVQQFAVSFDAKGGLPVPGVVNINYGEKITAPNPAPTKTGYTLEGWYANPECTGEAWDFENDTVTGATTLYAKWEPEKYAVTFDVKGGEQVDDTAYQQVPYNTAIEAPTPPTREGYTFQGWYKEDGCTTPWSFAEDKVTGPTTLYAKWEIKTYTVTFDTDGGTPVASQSVEHGSKAEAPSATPVKDGYTFTGWVTTKDGSDEFNFTNTNITGDTTVYAKWAPIQYEVTYDGNTSTGGTAPGKQVWTYGQTDEFLAAEPGELAKTDYTFTSWNTANDGSGTTYLPGDPIVLTENITLYAQWISNSAAAGTITFDGNGSDGGSMTPQTYDASTPLTANGFTKTGYTFAGWSRNQDGTGARYEDGATLPSNPGDITLYAQWAMDVTLRLSESDSVAGEGIGYLQENSMLSLEAGDTDLTYKAEGTAKYNPYFQNYFANGQGEQYSADEAPKIIDGMEDSDHPNYDWSGNFLVFDIVDENGKHTNDTTVSVQSDSSEIVANGKIEFAEVEGKQTATVAVKLDDTRKTNGIAVVVDWDGDGAEAPVTYTLDVSGVALQSASIVLGETITAYTDLANDNTVVGQTTGGAPLKPADLLKSLSMEDGGETIKATLKYVKDTAAEDGPGYYLTFQVNSPEMDTQPDGMVKLFFNWDWENDKLPDDESPEGSVHYPDLVLTGSDFVKNGNRYTTTVAYRMDPATYVPGRGLMLSATWMNDNTWNEAQRGFGVNVDFVPRNTAALMLTRDANAPGQDHWPFLFGGNFESGDRPAQDLFMDGPDDLAEKFKIEQFRQAEENTIIYQASGYLRFHDDFRAYATDRYPEETPEQSGEEGPGENWEAARSGWYVPVDIVNVNNVDVSYAQAQVYNGNPAEGGQLIYTLDSAKFDRTVQTESGEGYPNSATLVQNLKIPNGAPLEVLFIVVDWNTQDDSNAVETLVLRLENVTRQQPTRVEITPNNEYQSTAYGQDLQLNEYGDIVGTLLYTTPKTDGDSGYYLPITFRAKNENLTLDNKLMMQYRFNGPEDWHSDYIELSASDFTDNTATVLVTVPAEVAANPEAYNLEVIADWDGPDYTEDGPQTGHMAFGETGRWLNLYGLQTQSQHHLISAHNLGDETGLETVPADKRNYKYDYVNWEAENGPAKATANATLDPEQYEYQGKSAGELVGGDFRITSDDGDTYYALGLVKYVDSFNSYWFNHARETFFYRGRTNAPSAVWFPEEHFAKEELRNVGLMSPEDYKAWLDSHSNAASFGYYLVFDLEKDELDGNGKIEITDAAVESGSKVVRTINAADFGAEDKIPVVYQLKQRDVPPSGQNQGPFANELTIKYYKDGSAVSKSVALKLAKPIGADEKEVLRPQNIPEVRFNALVPADNATQTGMQLVSSAGPADELRDRDFTLYGGILQQESQPPYNLTLDFSSSVPGENEWPTARGEDIPDEMVVVRIDLDPKDGSGAESPAQEITKGMIKNNPQVVIEGVRRMSGMFVRVNWAGVDDAPERFGEKHFYIDLNNLAYPPDGTPDYSHLGTVLKSKEVTATSETVTVGDTAIDENGATGTPNAFGVVNVHIGYEGLQPKMTQLGEMTGYFGAFSLKAPEGATAYYSGGWSGDNTYQVINNFSRQLPDNQNHWNLDMLYCTGLKQQVLGIYFDQLRMEEQYQPYTVAVQWYSGGPTKDDTNAPYTPLGSPVYYNENPVEVDGTTSYMRLNTVPGLADMSDENQAKEPNDPAKYQPVLDPDGTWLYLNGSYDAANNTWAPENWQPLRLVSSENPAYAEGYYVELELLAPMAVAESGVGDDTVLCTVTGGALGGETIELKKSDLVTAHKWGTPIAWLPVIVKVAESTANAGTDHGGEVTFTVDWDGAYDAYAATTYKLNLDKVALDNTPLETETQP